MSTTTTPPTRAPSGRKRASNADHTKQQAALSEPQQRDVRSKLLDFNRMVDDIVTENEDAKLEIARIKQQLADSAKQLESAKTENELKDREIELRSEEVEELKAENAELQLKVDKHDHDAAELTNTRKIVSAIRGHLRDYITLDTVGASMLTTTGQVRNLQ